MQRNETTWRTQQLRYVADAVPVLPIITLDEADNERLLLRKKSAATLLDTAPSGSAVSDALLVSVPRAFHAQATQGVAQQLSEYVAQKLAQLQAAQEQAAAAAAEEEAEHAATTRLATGERTQIPLQLVVAGVRYMFNVCCRRPTDRGSCQPTRGRSAFGARLRATAWKSCLALTRYPAAAAAFWQPQRRSSAVAGHRHLRRQGERQPGHGARRHQELREPRVHEHAASTSPSTIRCRPAHGGGCGSLDKHAPNAASPAPAPSESGPLACALSTSPRRRWTTQLCALTSPNLRSSSSTALGHLRRHGARGCAPRGGGLQRVDHARGAHARVLHKQSKEYWVDPPAYTTRRPGARALAGRRRLRRSWWGC